MQNKTGIYIHIPFCVKKCSYCAFLSFRAEDSPRKEYTDALVNEIRLRAAGYEGLTGVGGCAPGIDTVYVGGGTPSVLDISQLRDIMHAVRTSFRIKPDAEITIEVNPGTLGRKDGVTAAKLKAYRYMGFNRLSMGVQSMDNDRLSFLGRIHTAEDVVRDFRLAREQGFDNINLDLIFSVPGQSAEDALSDASRLIDLGPEHISCYSLQIEEGTPFYEAAERGELKEVSDEEDRETYHRLIDLLRGAGYEHYEISNFARMPGGGRAPGFEAAPQPGLRGGLRAESGGVSPYRSRHNSLYWDMSGYIGLGLGASGFTGGVRYRNISDLDEYIRLFGGCRTGSCGYGCGADSRAVPDPDGEISVPVAEEHANSRFDSISEAVFTGLRRREGISYREAMDAWERAPEREAADAKEDFWDIFSASASEAEGYAARGLLTTDDEGLRLTEQGIDISNSIMSLFV